MRKCLRFDAPTGALDYAKCVGESALIAQRSEIAGIHNAEIAEQLPFDHGRRNLAEKRIQQVGALLVIIVGCPYFAHPCKNLCLNRQIPRHEVQLVRDLHICVNGFVDCGQSRLQLSLMQICFRKRPSACVSPRQ